MDNELLLNLIEIISDCK